ncbi:hypothetical protein [Microbacterium sp. NPDC077486]|uniref:hypothetical protein n=1 Tax=Microbacterium sp. NPDC077486 TaxID=3154766 RepID=UPI00344699B9
MPAASASHGGVSVREAEWPQDSAFVGTAVSTYLRQTEQEKHDVLAEAEGAVRLSVWEWRDAAIRLYTSRGFRPVDPWDDRDRLLCFESLTSLHPAAESSEVSDSKG